MLARGGVRLDPVPGADRPGQLVVGGAVVAVILAGGLGGEPGQRGTPRHDIQAQPGGEARRPATVLPGHRPRRPGLAEAYRRADEQVLSQIRQLLGLDQLRLALSGAAPIAPEILTFMLALGIPVIEVWGMSECCGAGTANPPDDIRIGTVGPALPGVQLKLADDGELLLRGPIMMKGYRNDPVRTAEAIDSDGGLHSGDLAAIDEDGYVRITGRKKELIISSAGKNMSPTTIEGAVWPPAC
jgi:long-subunit acyl-CoA synthetase (AMP-forming)